jgi:amino acid transporter
MSSRDAPLDVVGPPDAPFAVEAEKRKLRKVFSRLDLLTYLICSLVGLDTIGAVAKQGAQGFTWLIFLAWAFFLPYGLLVAELGSTFPEEGGAYVWTRKAFGPFLAAISNFLYWVSNPIWLGGLLTITAITAFSAFLVPLGEQSWLRYPIGLAFIWITIAFSILSVRIGRWVGIIGAWARLIVFGVFTAALVLYAEQHHLHGIRSGFRPTYVGFIAAAPVLVFNFVGFEVPSAAGEEMKNPARDVPRSVLGAGIATILFYGIPAYAILSLLPQQQITGLGGFVDAIKLALSAFGGSVDPHGAVTLSGAGLVAGWVMAIAFLAALMASAGTWLMGADRALAIAALEGAAPAVVGRFSEGQGTPIVANVLSGIGSTITMVLAMSLSRDASAYFVAVLGLAVSTTTISYLAVFPALVRLRYREPSTPRPYRIPGGLAGAWVCCGLATLWVLLATIVQIWPGLGVGWFGTAGNPDDSLPKDFTRKVYELTQIIPLLALAGVAAVLYALGRRRR